MVGFLEWLLSCQQALVKWLNSFHGPETGYVADFVGAIPEGVFVFLAIVIPVLVVGLGIQAVAGISTFVERKVAAKIQLRLGPMECNVGSFVGAFARAFCEKAAKPGASMGARALALVLGPLIPLLDALDKIVTKRVPGLPIFAADGLKLIMKEDIIPAAADNWLFRAAPTIVLASAFAALACLPYSDRFYVADFNIGIFYLAAVTSLEVMGILMAGWASNNKWSLLGGMRSAAQITSYEIPAGLTILTAMIVSGTMSMQGLTVSQLGVDNWQLGWAWNWYAFSNPLMTILVPIYFLAALAECNRTPFDIPEAESELVSGYHTEYSGMRFALFFMAEYAMMFVTSAIAVTIFFGGWSTGIGVLERAMIDGQPTYDSVGQVTAVHFHWWGSLIHLLAFLVKTYLVVLIMIWVRWAVPRFRPDQMMALCWKRLMPIGMVAFLGASAWLLIRGGLTGGSAEKSLQISQATGVLSLFVFLAVLGGIWIWWKKPAQ